MEEVYGEGERAEWREGRSRRGEEQRKRERKEEVEVEVTTYK